MSAAPHAVPAMVLGAGMMMFPVVAEAHLVNPRFGDFYGGLLHLLLSLEHLLPMLALGMLAGLQDPRVGRWILLAAPLGLLCGILLAPGTSVELPPVWLNPAAFVALGLLVAAGRRLPMAVLAAIAWLAGVAQGYGNGLAMGEETALVLFALGVLACGFVLLALVAATVVVLLRSARWTRVAVRAGGSWIAAVGLMIAVAA